MIQKRITRVLSSFLSLSLFLVLAGNPGQAFEFEMVPDPGQPGPCGFEERNVELQGIATNLFLPLQGSCDSWREAPFPGLVFAHGFSMMGFTDSAADVAGHGAHLASWGIWVAIPVLPDDAGQRISDFGEVIDELLMQANTPGSQFYQLIHPQQVAVAGYSLGGATALAISARDSRVQAVVALDPVYHEGGFEGEGDAIWNPEVEGVNISAPTGILGSPPSGCNAESDYADIFENVGAVHKAAYLVENASHCDFLDPGNTFCPLFCEGTTSAARTVLSQGYMTAWLNYYLLLKDDYYYWIFGDGLSQDMGNGLITPEIETSPRNLHGVSIGDRVFLSWEVYAHPVVGGYNLYRRESGGFYPEKPIAELDVIGWFTDSGVISGEQYLYKVCSYDPGGNQHQCGAEISVTAGEDKGTFLPLVVKH